VNPLCRFEVFQGSRRPEEGTASSAYMHVTATGRVNQWDFNGDGNAQHTFHLHTHSFQVISYTPYLNTNPAPNTGPPPTGSTTGDAFSIGEWRDTIPVFQGNLTVRFRPLSLPGEVVLHCHYLRHEDIGMMSSVYICDGSGTNGVEMCPKLILSRMFILIVPTSVSSLRSYLTMMMFVIDDTTTTLSAITSTCGETPSFTATLRGATSSVTIVGRTLRISATLGSTTRTCTATVCLPHRSHIISFAIFISLIKLMIGMTNRQVHQV
jgi:hypothetical protein